MYKVYPPAEHKRAEERRAESLKVRPRGTEGVADKVELL